MYILSSETVLIDVNVISFMDMQVPPVAKQPKTFRSPQRTFGVKNNSKKIIMI